MDNQLEDSTAVRATDDLIPVSVRLVPTCLEAVPKHLRRLLLGDAVFSKLLFVELISELRRIEWMPPSLWSIVPFDATFAGWSRARGEGHACEPCGRLGQARTNSRGPYVPCDV